jgi:hypothetical protein
VAVDVSAFECLPFLGTQAGRGSEQGQWAIGRRQLDREGVELGARVDADRAGWRLAVAACKRRRIAGHVPPAHGGSECLSECLHDPVPAAFGQLGLPGGKVPAHSLEVAQRHVTERPDGVAQALAQGGNCPWADASRVAVEVEIYQLRRG